MSGMRTMMAESSSLLQCWRLPTRGACQTLYVYLCLEHVFPPQPKIELTARSDCQAIFLPPGERTLRRFELVAGRIEISSDAGKREDKCGFWEIDRSLMPGVYGLQVSQSMRTSGITWVRLGFAHTQPLYLMIHGVDYDPYDGFALGLTTWMRTNCHEHLTSGLRKSMPNTLRPILDEYATFT